jgi:hypothetical protein
MHITNTYAHTHVLVTLYNKSIRWWRHTNDKPLLCTSIQKCRCYNFSFENTNAKGSALALLIASSLELMVAYE